MKRFLFPLVVVALSISNAQKLDDTFGFKEKVFRLALKYNDLVVAKQSLYEMMVLKPEMKSLKDSLNIIYFNLGAYRESVLLSNEILEEAKGDQAARNLEIRAISYQNLGFIKESLQDYEKLFASNKSIYHLYQMAALQFELKRYGECEQSISAILKHEESQKATISMPVDNRNQQKIPILAAAYNMKGVLAMETNNMEQAKKNFEEALKIEPEFVLVKNNLEVLKQKSNPKSDTPKPATKSAGQK